MAITRRQSVLAEVEAAYGTDPIPAGTDAMLAIDDLTVEVIRESGDLEPIDPFLDPLALVPGAMMMKVNFTTALRGSGAAGTAPEITPLLRGCGFNHVNVPATSDTFEPTSDFSVVAATGYQSLTLYIQDGNHQFQIHGAYGTFGLQAAVGSYCKMAWQFTGLYERPTDFATFTAPTYDVTRPQPCRGMVITIMGTAASATLRPSSWTMDLNREVVASKSMAATFGYAAFELGRCVPSGTFRVQELLLATEDFFANLEDATLATLSLAFGATAGNIVTVSFPGSVALSSLARVDDGGLLSLDLGYQAARSAGDDAVRLAYT